MAIHVPGSVKWYLNVSLEQKDSLAAIWHWDDLKFASENESIWIKDFTLKQVNSLEIKLMVEARIYYEENGKLFLKGSLLPSRRVPDVLWTPIKSALPIDLPSLNHNYFGLNQTVSVNLKSTQRVTEATAILVELNELNNYLVNAPEIRIEKLIWTIIDNNYALIIGKPLLPVRGTVYWQRENFFLPLGFDFEFFSLSNFLEQKLNEHKSAYILVSEEKQYCFLPKDRFAKLSRSSWRRSFLSEPESNT